MQLPGLASWVFSSAKKASERAPAAASDPRAKPGAAARAIPRAWPHGLAAAGPVGIGVMTCCRPCQSLRSMAAPNWSRRRFCQGVCAGKSAWTWRSGPWGSWRGRARRLPAHRGGCSFPGWAAGGSAQVAAGFRVPVRKRSARPWVGSCFRMQCPPVWHRRRPVHCSLTMTSLPWTWRDPMRA